ncbi:MAG: gamma-glutamyltransferase [Acidobacteria bacterium 13_1_40CM_3_65_5]|nr:MAG: gamma-glutamyltransferase [Acidobacteria bacterium 13_1_40CM_3_65_5]
MKRFAIGTLAALVVVTASHAQTPDTRPRPGDRPAANPHSTRSVVYGRNGMIATSQPLASAAGLKVLQDGGNAIDAAVAAAAVLAVVEPTMTGIGGDLFAIIYDAKTKTLRGLNASGRSGYAATPDQFAKRNLTRVPNAGVYSVTVPGVVEGWSALLSAYGTKPLAQLIAPAIGHAKNGYAVSEIISRQWQSSERKLSADPAAAKTFLPGGHAPKPGEVFANPNLAATLQTIAAGGRDAFYKGPIARAIIADMKQRDGLLDERDFTEHKADWVQPISTTYRGYDVFEMPPNTQGFVTLEMLNILEGFDVKSLGHNSPEYLHLLVEAKRIAFADRAAYLGDPDSVPAPVLKTLISKDYAAARRKEIDPLHAAQEYKPGAIKSVGSSAGDKDIPGWGPRSEKDQNFTGLDLGDTIYMTAADGQGNFISLIQSLFADFGSGIVAGDTGIVLHNRGASFNLTAGHPDQIAPHKRPLHTLVPAFIMKDGKPWVSYGVMGGDHQAQGHTQVVVNLIDFGMNIQEAGEAARVNHGNNGLQVESAVSEAARAGLTDRGHKVTVSIGAYGGFQGIMFDPRTGVLMGGSDPRKDGLAIGW